MHIAIEAECRRGLRIIEEIPDISLCKIAGYNGIGKTNAIRLLRLCTGEQPFEADAASWRTFRSQLVRARVHVTGLRGADDIEWLINPEIWPEDPAPLGDRLGIIRISGQSSRLRDVGDLLKIHHLNTTETPATVLARRAHTAHQQVTEWYSTQGRRRQDEIEMKLFDLQKAVANCFPSQLHHDLNAAQEAKRAYRLLETQLKVVRERAQLLDEAADTAERLDQVRGRGPEMDAKISELQDHLDGIDSKKQNLDNQIIKASSLQHASQQAEREFENAQKYLIRQEKALRDTTGTLEKLAASAGIDPHPGQVGATRAALSGSLNDLVRQLPQVNATPMLVSVLNDLAQRLEEAERHELGDTVLIESTTGEVSWTVAGLRTTLLQQARALSQTTPTTDAQRLTAQISEIRGRLDALAQIEHAFQDVQQAQSNLSRAKDRIRKAASDLPEQAIRTLDELMEARNKLDQQRQSVQSELSTLSHARDLLGGGLTEDALAAKLLRLCKAVGVDAARVLGRQKDMHAELEDLVRREAQAAQLAERSERLANQRLAEVDQVVQHVGFAEDTAWLRRAAPSLAGIHNRGPTERAALLEQLVSRLEHARTALRESNSAVEGIGAALGTLSARLRNPDGRPNTDTLWNTASRLWLAEEVRQWFDDDVIRKALFGGAQDIRLDPHELTVSWTVDGELRERPLSAFSSGQQAFAYTQAQVAQLDRQDLSTANRLVALDEFSSLLDIDRMKDLVSYLAKRQQVVAHDQVVLILPLDGSVTDVADSDGDNATRLRDLRRRGYYAEAAHP